MIAITSNSSSAKAWGPKVSTNVRLSKNGPLCERERDMTWVFAVVAIILVVALALLLAGRLPAVPQPTAPPRSPGLPERPTLADIDSLRLPVALRGYRMDEVDAALTVLRHRIAELEQAASTPTSTGVTDGRPQDAATDS